MSPESQCLLCEASYARRAQADFITSFEISFRRADIPQNNTQSIIS